LWEKTYLYPWLQNQSYLSPEKNFFATVELDFEPILGLLALLYLSWNIDLFKRLCWGHRVVLFYILYFCYIKREEKPL